MTKVRRCYADRLVKVRKCGSDRLTIFCFPFHDVYVRDFGTYFGCLFVGFGFFRCFFATNQNQIIEFIKKCHLEVEKL